MESLSGGPGLLGRFMRRVRPPVGQSKVTTLDQAARILGSRAILGLHRHRSGMILPTRGVPTEIPFSEAQLRLVRDLSGGRARLVLRHGTLRDIVTEHRTLLEVSHSVVDALVGEPAQEYGWRLCAWDYAAEKYVGILVSVRDAGLSISTASVTTGATATILEYLETGRFPIHEATLSLKRKRRAVLLPVGGRVVVREAEPYIGIIPPFFDFRPIDV